MNPSRLMRRVRIVAALQVVAIAGFGPGALGADVSVTSRGAVGDGTAVDTRAIQQAIDSCSASGGGEVTFPAGRFLTGTIQLKDNVTLRLTSGTVLLGNPDPADYRNVDPFTAGDGIPLGHALIVADGARNVGIEGGGGLIDGQGRAVRAAQQNWTVRPMLMRWIRCDGIAVRNVRLTNPGAWTLNFFQSKNIDIAGVTIRSRQTGLRNNDGIDLDSCQDARIANCDIESGDDAFCLKSTSPIATSGIVAKNLKLATNCNAIKMGTESLGGFHEIEIRDVQVTDAGMAGIALYCVDGGELSDVTIEDVTMKNLAAAISIRLGARLKTFRPEDERKSPGTLRDVTLRNIKAEGVRYIGMLANGIPGHRIEDLTLENVTLEVRGGGSESDARVELPENVANYPEWSMFGRVFPAYGIYLRHAAEVKLKNVVLKPSQPDARPERVLIDAKMDG